MGPADAMTAEILLAVHSWCDGLEGDPRWPAILVQVATAVTVGDVDGAAETLHRFLRDTGGVADPGASGLLADEVLREAADTLVAALARRFPKRTSPC